MKIRLTFGEWYDRVEVERDGEWKRLDPTNSQAVWNHSPDGFSWGYSGSGPAQLALALLLEAGLPDALAVRLHQQFKRQFVAAWTREVREVEIDMDEWVRAHRDEMLQARAGEMREADDDMVDVAD